MTDDTYTVNGRCFRLAPIEEPGALSAGLSSIIASETAPILAELHEVVTQALDKIATRRFALRGFLGLVQGHSRLTEPSRDSFEEFLAAAIPAFIAQLDMLDDEACDLEWRLTHDLAALLAKEEGRA